MMETLQDLDPEETGEWLDSLDAVIDAEGVDRAHFLLNNLLDKARQRGAYLPYNANTPYVNTIPPDRQPRYPGDREIERRISSIVRWNAVAMVVRANKESSELGGHIATFQSAATLYDIGFNHFWRAPTENHCGDLIYTQGHSSPGIYARAFVEGRLTEEQLLHFRREVDGNGLSSYPHPWLMPDFWQFATVSMGLGPMMAIYQARFMKYLQGRGLAQTGDRKVWCFVGDGEMDEPESLGAISLASRERLDNLIFVVNCNLQRLDGPVRGNGKIIQELEAVFRGAGWNVIKVIWGSNWDALLARDKLGLLRKRMEECVDGEYQAFKARDGAYVRKEFFAKYPQLLDMVSGMTDEEVWQLRRGGHDPLKVYAAYAAAVSHSESTHRDSRQDHQGLRNGRGRRGHEHHPSAEEDGSRGAEGLSRSLQNPGARRPDRRGPDLPSARRQHRNQVHQRSAARRLEEAFLSGAATPIRSTCRHSPLSKRCSKAPKTGRFRPPWRSCASCQR